MTTTSEEFTEQWLRQTLAALGTDADQVAASLRAAKITGDRNGPSTCPIARYLGERAGARWPSARVTATVSACTVTVGLDLPEADYRYVQTRPPEAVQAFIRVFDTGGAYSDLDAGLGA